MRIVVFLLSFLVTGQAFAVSCYKLLSHYGCSNASGTTCTKVLVNSLVPDTVTTVGSCNYLVVNGTEYASLLTATTTNNNQDTSINNLNTVVNGHTTTISTLNASDTSQGTRITTLENSVGGVSSAVSNQNASIAQAVTSVGNLNAQLNTPFDSDFALAGTAFFFSAIILVWSFAKGGGVVLSMLRHPTRKNS